MDKSVSNGSMVVLNILSALSMSGLNKIEVQIRDRGCGIADVQKAREPLFTTLGGDRSGLGFSVMESFCDRVRVRSELGKGTTVTLTKIVKGRDASREP